MTSEQPNFQPDFTPVPREVWRYDDVHRNGARQFTEGSQPELTIHDIPDDPHADLGGGVRGRQRAEQIFEAGEPAEVTDVPAATSQPNSAKRSSSRSQRGREHLEAAKATLRNTPRPEGAVPLQQTRPYRYRIDPETGHADVI